MRSEQVSVMRDVKRVRYVFPERPSVAQFRGARAMLCVSQKYLAQVAGVSAAALCKLEKDAVVTSDEIVVAVVRAIRKLGVEFTPTGIQFVDITEWDA